MTNKSIEPSLTKEECKIDKLLCREGSCPNECSTIIESKTKQRTFKYYLCNKHWRELLGIWNDAKGF